MDETTRRAQTPLGAAVQAARESKRLKKTPAANRAGVHPSYWTHVERGYRILQGFELRVKPSAGTLIKMLHVGLELPVPRVREILAIAGYHELAESWAPGPRARKETLDEIVKEVRDGLYEEDALWLLKEIRDRNCGSGSRRRGAS